MTARGTAARVARLRRDLGDRDVAVLDSLWRVRLLTTDQVRRLHFADNSPSTQARRCRWWCDSVEPSAVSVPAPAARSTD